MAYCSSELPKRYSQPHSDSPRFTITQMKFSPSKNPTKVCKPDPQITQQPVKFYSSSLQCLHRGTLYRRDKQKKHQRLQSQRKVIFLQQIATEPRGPLFRTYSQRLSHPVNDKIPTQNFKQQIVSNIHNEIKGVQSQRKLPSIKFQLTFLRSKVQTATRLVNKAPMELLTRKLEWQGKPTRKLIPYTRQDSTRLAATSKAATGKYEGAYERKAWLKLSGWGDEHSLELMQGKVKL